MRRTIYELATLLSSLRPQCVRKATPPRGEMKIHETGRAAQVEFAIRNILFHLLSCTREQQMTTWRFTLAALAFVPAIGTAATVEFINQSSWDIYEIYFSPASHRNWGQDFLDDDVLEKGDSLTLTDIDAGAWDVMVVDEDGDKCVLEDIEFDDSDRDQWVITDKDLLACQAAS